MGSGVPDSASHHALLNQCRKSETLSDPAKTLVKCVGSASTNALATIALPKAELNRRFNEKGCVERAYREKYTCCLRDFYPCRFPDEPEAWSMVIGFDDPTGIRRFYVHAFIRFDGSIASSELPEPTFFLDDDGIAYRRAPNP